MNREKQHAWLIGSGERVIEQDDGKGRESGGKVQSRREAICGENFASNVKRAPLGLPYDAAQAWGKGVRVVKNKRMNWLEKEY
jgi:hypothetical protein